MPESLGDFYVWVNVPEFTLRVVKDGKVIHTERVDRRQARYADAGILAGHGAGDLPSVLGRPGVHQAQRRPAQPGTRQHAALHALQPAHPARRARRRSRVRRLGDAPTSASSTSTSRPARPTCWASSSSASPTSTTSTCTTRRPKHLFNADVRAFSHGCMRVRDPQRLAELLLAEDQGWPARRVAAAISRRAAEQPDQPHPQDPRPHHLLHRRGGATTGKLKQFPDIYGHEQRIALGMEGKAHLVARS